MPIKAEVQEPVVDNAEFAVALKPDSLQPQRCKIRVLVAKEPRCFKLDCQQQACAEEHTVDIVGTTPIVVCAGWGKDKLNKGKALVVEVRVGAEEPTFSEPRTVLAGDAQPADGAQA